MKNCTSIILLALHSFLAGAQTVSSISLNGLLDSVETNFPAIQQLQLNVQGFQERSKGARAWMSPVFSAGFMQFPYDLSMIDNKDDPMNQAAISFALEQMIPNPAKLNAKKSYLESLVEAERSKEKWTKNELRLEAKRLYYNRYVTEKKLKVIDESEELLRVLISVAEDKFTNNQSSLQTIYKAQARLAELNNMSTTLNSQLYETITGINILLVRDPSTPFDIDTLLVPAGYSGMTQMYREGNRSDIAVLSYNIESMKKEQVQMKLEGRPDFGIRAEHMQMFGMPNQWTLMGMLTIPIVPWSSSMYRSETRSANFRIQAMEKEKQVMELMANKMVWEKYYMLKSETDQYSNYQKFIIPAYEKNYEANLLSYRRNTGDFFVLLDAWEMVLMKKLESLDRLNNVFKLQAEYEYENEIR